MDRVEREARTPAAAKTPAVPASGAPGGPSWSVLALQRSAGNRAVTSLVSRSGAPAAGRGGSSPAVLQRQPDDEADEVELPEEERVWPVAWPEETEGEQHAECFDPDTRTDIVTGAMQALSASRKLATMPPKLEEAVGEIYATLDIWTPAAGLGEGPGVAALNEAISMARRAGERLAIYVVQVPTILEALSQAATEAGTAAGAAAEAMTPAPPAPEGEEVPEEGEAADQSRPCFDEDQQAIIVTAVGDADAAASELNQRPPNYPKALRQLRAASTALAGVGGEAPGQAMLQGAVATLDAAIESVHAYLTPVEKVVAEATADMRVASAQANRAAVMRQAARKAAGPPEQPEPPPLPNAAPPPRS
jgi:hypothetical protein